MTDSAPACPLWLAERLRNHGGAVGFRQYMEWALHDPQYGAYGAGRLRIGLDGDFVTSPALGPDFAALLAPQLADWLDALGPGPLHLIETGPGEGSLALQLAEELQRGWPELADRLTLLLLEPNPGMADRQRRRLSACPLPCRWTDWPDLAAGPVRGVVLAHEVLDALAVERIVSDGGGWRWQEVALVERASGPPALELRVGDRLDGPALAPLAALGLESPGPSRPAGWSSELHAGVAPWLEGCATALEQGVLLVIDYALEAGRYYDPRRSSGTLMAYRAQRASPDPLRDPGAWDLTAHLCIEALEQQACRAGWLPLGHCRQGEALLALGLAQRLHGLQHEGTGPARALAPLLARREALLRLVDPHALGSFRWLALGRGAGARSDPPLACPRFLREPEPLGWG